MIAHAIRTSLSFVDERPWANAAVAAAPVPFVALVDLAKLVAPGGYIYLVREDGPVEWATFVVYLLACGFAIDIMVSLRRRGAPAAAALYALLAVGLFVIAMEEVSWGQRLFGVATPASIAGINSKHELNFHNISGFPLELAFMAVGFYGSFSRLLLPPSVKVRHAAAIEWLTPPIMLFFYFFFTFVLFSYYFTVVIEHAALVEAGAMTWEQYWSQGQFVIGKDQEPMELLLAIGFLLFTWRNSGRNAATGVEQ